MLVVVTEWADHARRISKICKQKKYATNQWETMWELGYRLPLGKKDGNIEY